MSEKNLLEAIKNQNDVLEAQNRKILEGIKDIKAEAKDLMTMDEACEFFNIAKQTMYARIKNRTIPFMKDERKVFFSKKDLINSLTKFKDER